MLTVETGNAPTCPPLAPTSDTESPVPWGSTPTPCCVRASHAKLCGGFSPPFRQSRLLHNYCSPTNPFAFGFAGIHVDYRRCQDCGFIFTGFFDDWTPDEFSPPMSTTPTTPKSTPNMPTSAQPTSPPCWRSVSAPGATSTCWTTAPARAPSPNTWPATVSPTSPTTTRSPALPAWSRNSA